MNHIKAIGFDLFNTLIAGEPSAIREAVSRLIRTLRQNDLDIEPEAFVQAHRDAAMRFIRETRSNGRETHNSFWISAALETLGFSVPPDDVRISRGVDAYFSAFLQNCRLIPGTREMLETIRGQYRLGLLSNFTHAPAARQIIEALGLTPFFDTVIISGDIGYCKPNPLVFQRLIDQLGVEKSQALYVGDDVNADIAGARLAGLQPVWMTYTLDKDVPPPPGIPSEAVDEPDSTVPRVSNWEAFLALLDGERRGA